MLRLHEENINTSEWFDKVWTLEQVHRYDTVRLRAMLEVVNDGDTICELGCGVYGFAQYALDVMKMRVDAFAVDFSAVALSMALKIAPTLRIRQENALHTSFNSEFFDVVGAGELIEHIEQPMDLVKEMNRICKPGGYLVISTVDPDCPDAIAHGDYPEHLWRFGVEELKALFRPFGAVAYRLVGDYHMIYCRKGSIRDFS